ncbi:ankyrin repeat-containing domain protein [Podospora didyma]|uniref:Ankyrin repeat-containing domain protein n=1 Tax=Podospora didyma TaxID=330526 RepID=A0AAE0KJT8_9PEZI|nr:ankyrin repeat-containing domain protein [Podospora didyma]
MASSLKITEEEIDDLLYSARAGETEDLSTLLAALADREKVSPAEILASAKDEGKSTCLHMATGNGHTEIVKIIISHFTNQPKETKQAFFDAPNEYGNTGLHWAALGGHLDVVKLLVEEGGATPALANDKNYVPLDLAYQAEKLDVANYFLEKAGMLEGQNGDEALGNAVADVKLDEEDGDRDEGEEVVEASIAEGEVAR